MISTYRLNADELSAAFIQSLKKAYQHRDIEIIVQEVQDETEYLLSSPANAEHLLQGLEDIKNNKNLVSMPLDDIE